MKRRPAALSAPQGPIIGFLCPKIPARLLRSSCGTRHVNAGTPWEPGSRKTKIFSEVCATCETGAAHAKGLVPAMWPDGTPIMPVELVPVKSLVRSKPLSRAERLEMYRR